MIANFTFIIILGLACIYTLISALLINSALSRITGKEMKHLMMALFIAVMAGFFFGVFQLLNQLNLITAMNKLIVDYISNFFLFTMFVMLVYLSFLARELGKKFGFKSIANDIKKRLNSKQGRKHRS